MSVLMNMRGTGSLSVAALCPESPPSSTVSVIVGGSRDDTHFA